MDPIDKLVQDLQSAVDDVKQAKEIMLFIAAVSALTLLLVLIKKS
jgi:hypothetical protein